MLRRNPYPDGLETRNEIRKHFNKLLEMDVIRKLGHKKIVEFTKPIMITWDDSKSKFCGDFRALDDYAKADRHPITRIIHHLKKLEK
ncbi:hypothetical protein O181_119081 [Austropuccinia psidii MF-1]|uniref:Uncharacterized protein n=1 Tax=Austropuccinia psidii MF-1 TaxID=1389203 RepID=A0A9Q3PZC2_9BASI|nr:hypothetical protein [Austropuccinia psidii MF-1]